MMSFLKPVLSLCAAVLLSFVSAPPASAAPTDFGNDRIVVLISLDGLAAYYLDDPKAEMPTIRRLAAEGTRAASMKASVPTVTWPNHTTLVTGVNPARHGVVGNNYYDRATGRQVVLICDADFDKDQIVKVPTIYDVAKAAGLKTASVRWPATRNAKSLDWTTADVASVALWRKTATPSLLAEARDAGLLAEVDAAEKREKGGRWLPSDEACTRLFNFILRRHRPNLALLHLVDADHVQHLSGPGSPEAYAAIKSVDEHVRQVWETLQAEFPGKATLLLAADHGFSPIKRIILPNVVLRKAHLLNAVAEGAEPKPLVRVVPQGGCAMIYILDDAKRDETVTRVKHAFAGMEGVSTVLGPDEVPAYGVAKPQDNPKAPDMLLFADLGYAFGDTAAGDLPFEAKPERKGTHGHDPNLPELHASFVAWGAGIRPGATLGEIDNTSVTPTIARLLNLNMPGLDGAPLTAALKD